MNVGVAETLPLKERRFVTKKDIPKSILKQDRQERVDHIRRAKEYKLKKKHERWDAAIERGKTLSRTRGTISSRSSQGISPGFRKKVRTLNSKFKDEKATFKEYLVRLRKEGKLLDMHFAPSLDYLRERLETFKKTGKMQPSKGLGVVVDAETGKEINIPKFDFDRWYDDISRPIPNILPERDGASAESKDGDGDGFDDDSDDDSDADPAFTLDDLSSCEVKEILQSMGLPVDVDDAQTAQEKDAELMLRLEHALEGSKTRIGIGKSERKREHAPIADRSKIASRIGGPRMRPLTNFSVSTLPGSVVSASEKLKSPGFSLKKHAAKMSNDDKLEYIIASRRRAHEYLAGVIEQEGEAEKQRQVKYRLETSKVVKSWLRQKFRREREKAKKRIALIMGENQMGIAAKMAQLDIIR